MRHAAYMTSWGGIVAGRETEALALFQKAQDFWEKRQADGQVTRVGPFFLIPGSGASDDMEGFMALHYPALRILTNVKTRLFVGGTPQEVARIVNTATTQWQVMGLMKV